MGAIRGKLIGLGRPKQVDFGSIRGKLSSAALENGNCSMFVREAAELLFRRKYSKAHAWELAAKNRTVWKKTPRTAFKDTAPGNLLGIFLPGSDYNAPERPYTHVALYLGNGRILHNVDGDVRQQPLSEFLREKEGVDVREVIAPRRRFSLWPFFQRRNQPN